MKRYINTALLYVIFAMAGGVFYREFTKFKGFTDGDTEYDADKAVPIQVIFLLSLSIMCLSLYNKLVV